MLTGWVPLGRLVAALTRLGVEERFLKHAGRVLCVRPDDGRAMVFTTIDADDEKTIPPSQQRAICRRLGFRLEDVLPPKG